MNDLDDEYRSFQITKDQHHFNQNLKIPEFWYKLREIKNGLGQPKYLNLSDFMTSLPHSSACGERIFSQVNTVKTKKTNKLKANTSTTRQGRSQKKIERGPNFATFNVTSFSYNGILRFVNYARR